MTAVDPEASRQAVVEAALVLLERMGLTPADLAAVPQPRSPVPTFAEYIPVVSAAVSTGTRRAYGSYWNRVIEHWGGRRLDEPTPSEIRQLMAHVKTHVVARRNARGGRSAEEHLVAALRCLYQRAVDDGLIAEADNPARKVAKPRRLPSTRRALPDTRLAEINEVAAATGDDPELDTLLLRLHTETACRRAGALALRPDDLDPDQCLIRLREKGETVRWQPVSPTLMGRLIEHARERHALHQERQPGEARFCGTAQSLAMEMNANNLFNDRDDNGDLLARYRMLWLDYGTRLKRYTPRLLPANTLREAAGIGFDEMIALAFAYWGYLQGRGPGDPVRVKAMAARP